MRAKPLSLKAVSKFQAAFGEKLVTPSNSEIYNGRRKIFNGAIDNYPSALVRCENEFDVSLSIKIAREFDIPICVRSGGHSASGRSVMTDHLVIDLGGWSGVAVDAQTMQASVSPGTKLEQFDAETSKYGLATTMGIVSDTGVAGLTLGGGMGWLMGKYSLACDNLCAANIVLADGKSVKTSNENDYGDLHWALKGYGGNFGAVTQFTFNLYPQGPVTSGSIVYPISEASRAILKFDEISNNFSDELTCSPALITSEDGSKVLSIDVCHSGNPEAAESELRELRDDRSVLSDNIQLRSYTSWQKYLDNPFRSGRRSYWKTLNINSLNEEFVFTVVDAFKNVPSQHTMLTFDHVHGAASRVSKDATSFGDRSFKYAFLINTNWDQMEEDTVNIDWAKGLYSLLSEYEATHAKYINYLGPDEISKLSLGGDNGNLQRLKLLKDKYDPDNIFRGNIDLTMLWS